MLENYCDIIAIYCIILNYREIIAIIEKSIIAQGWSRLNKVEVLQSLQFVFVFVFVFVFGGSQWQAT